MTDPSHIIQMIGTVLQQRIEVYLWCDDCEHLSIIVKKRRIEHCACCGLRLPRRADAINYEGAN